MRFHNKLRDYAQVCSFGLFAGILARLTDFLPMDTLWSFPTIATMYGFWVVTVIVLVWRSTSHLTAGLNALLYLLFASVAFYGLQYLLGRFFPQFGISGFPVRMFLYRCVVSVVCGVAAMILYFWNHKAWYAAILLAVPIGILAAEAIHVLIQLQQYQTHLFQLLFNTGFCLYLGIQFRKMTKFKELYTVSVIAVTALCHYFLF